MKQTYSRYIKSMEIKCSDFTVFKNIIGHFDYSKKPEDECYYNTDPKQSVNSVNTNENIKHNENIT